MDGLSRANAIEMAGFKCAPETSAVVEIAIVTAIIQVDAIEKRSNESVKIPDMTEAVPICTMMNVPIILVLVETTQIRTSAVK